MKKTKNKNNLHTLINKYEKISLQKEIILNNLLIKFPMFYLKKTYKNNMSKKFKYLRILNLK